jgi:hypothetical protein
MLMGGRRVARVPHGIIYSLRRDESGPRNLSSTTPAAYLLTEFTMQAL